MVSFQSRQNLIQMDAVGLQGWAVNQNIIKKYNYRFPQEWLENAIHNRLKRRRSIGQAEGHHQELEMAIVCAKRRLKRIRLMHPNLMVPRTKGQLGKEPSRSQFIKELVRRWDRKMVWYRGLVQGPVIYAKPKRVLFLANQ